MPPKKCWKSGRSEALCCSKADSARAEAVISGLALDGRAERVQALDE